MHSLRGETFLTVQKVSPIVKFGAWGRVFTQAKSRGETFLTVEKSPPETFRPSRMSPPGEKKGGDFISRHRPHPTRTKSECRPNYFYPTSKKSDQTNQLKQKLVALHLALSLTLPLAYSTVNSNMNLSTWFAWPKL